MLRYYVCIFQRTIRGLKCDTFESVQFDKHFKGKKYHKLVVTAYFTQVSAFDLLNLEIIYKIAIQIAEYVCSQS